MKLVVGLGNPGPKYEFTRHNIGFLVMDKLAQEIGRQIISWSFDELSKCTIAKSGEIILAKPQTFVNASGMGVRILVAFYKLTPRDVWVVHDDLDLPLGKIRIRIGGGSPGHHGVDSVIRELKSADFVRVRLGIGRGKENTGVNTDRKIRKSTIVKFVLSKFRNSEAGELRHLVKRGAAAVRIGILEGTDKAMNRFN